VYNDELFNFIVHTFHAGVLLSFLFMGFLFSSMQVAETEFENSCFCVVDMDI